MANRAQIFQAILTSQRAGGVTLATGKAYFYEAGNQPTLKTIYLDRAKTTPAANPYTLSADGTAAIYGDGLYDVKITNAAGVEKFFWEDVKIQELAGETFANISDYADLAAAVAAIGATKTTLIIGSDQTVSDNLTVPATLELMLINGATITVASGKTLTINSPFAAPLQRIFPGTGTVAFGTDTVKEVYPEWWGVNTTPGTTDMTTAIAAALATGCNVYGGGHYAITSVTASTAAKKHYFRQLTLLADGTDIGITLSAANIALHVAKFNGNSQGRSGVSIAADRCRVLIDEIYNINAADTSTAFVSGVEVNSGTASHVEIKAHDFVRDIVASGSTPRVLTIQGTCSDTTGNVYAETVHGLVTCNTDAHLGIIHGEGCADNGVYHLGGNLVIDSLTYYGSEETVVTEVGSLTVGTIITGGESTAVVGLQDAGAVHIGSIILQEISSASPKQIVNTRAGNTASGKVYIGSIVGTMRGAYLSYMATGTVDFLTIGSIALTYNYDAVVSASVGSWWNISACKGFDIKHTHIRVIDLDDALAPTTYFLMTAPTTNLVYQSYVEDLDVAVYNSDLTTVSSNGSFRGANFAQNLVDLNNVTLLATTGPYLIRKAYTQAGVIALAAPTAGTWRKGMFVQNAEPAEAGGAPNKYVIFGWVCTVAGTPGTWLEVRTLTGN